MDVSTSLSVRGTKQAKRSRLRGQDAARRYAFPFSHRHLLTFPSNTSLDVELHSGADETRKNGDLHYPSHPARLQFGIWDASSPKGTSEWARGPIDWGITPERMSALIESIEVECPY